MAENRPLEPDAYNEVAGKVVVNGNRQFIPLVPVLVHLFLPIYFLTECA